MSRAKKIMLFALLVGLAAFVWWFVTNRGAKHQAVPLPAPKVTVTPAPEPVDLTQHERKTVDFSSGQPVVKDSAEDKAAIDAALKDMAEATKGVTFEAPPPKPAEPASTKK